jgi:glutamate-1-semialdehyde 2,1-aminomutase
VSPSASELVTPQALAGRMARVVPGGVNSNVRLDAASTFFARGKGAWLWDLEGNDYVDYVLGQGPAFLGHANEGVLRRVTEEIRSGMTFGAQTAVELAACELLVETLEWPEMVRVGMTSTESVQAALRLARSATGRSLFVRFRGQYHGWLDNVLVDSSEPWPRLASEGQLPESLSQSVMIEWNDLDALSSVIDRCEGQIAAVLTEPMMLNAGAILPEPGFLEGLRRLCDAAGIVLIFDETITGFRLALQGAAGRFGVTPDLAVYGKAVAGGFPASVLAGSAALMQRFATGTNHSGTFNANVLSCAAICGSLEQMTENPVHARVEQTGTELMALLASLFAELGVPLVVRGLPAAFYVGFDSGEPVRNYGDLQRSDPARYRRLVSQAKASGLWLTSRGIWFLSAAHDAVTTAATIERLHRALDALRTEETSPGFST